MARKRKVGEPEAEPLAAAPEHDHDGQVDGDQDGNNVDEVEVEQEVRLLRSFVHNEFTQSSEKKEIKKGGKKKKVVTWKSVCNHCETEFPHKKTSVLKRHLNSKHSPIGKIVEDKDDHARDGDVFIK